MDTTGAEDLPPASSIAPAGVREQDAGDRHAAARFHLPRRPLPLTAGAAVTSAASALEPGELFSPIGLARAYEVLLRLIEPRCTPLSQRTQ